MYKFTSKGENVFYRYGKLLFFLIFCTAAQNGIAQERVTGVVTDNNGVPLLGVNVIEQNTSNGTTTDFDGNFQIVTTTEDPILVFSYVGFTSQEVPLSGQEHISVTLDEDAAALEEVVVIGYGSQLQENITGSVSRINSEAIENIPQVSVDQLMQGRAAGVQVSRNSGQPGAAVSVRIRGVNTITGSSEPLYIIDGVPVSGEANEEGLSPLSALNPNDIESLNILKDASATAIYGSRGSNGVVLITTKKGKIGEGRFTYDSYMAVQRPTNKMDVMNLQQYATHQNTIGEIYGLDPQMDFLHPELLGPGTDWQAQIFDDALQQNHQLSFSGATEKINYFLSTSYTDQEGTVIGSAFDRATVRANLQADVNDWIKTGINISASRTNDQLTINNESNGIISLSLLNNPATAVYNPDGSFAGPMTPDEIAYATRNPIAEALLIDNTLQRNRVFGNLFVELDLHDNLSFRSEFGGDFGNAIRDNFRPTFSYGALERGQNQLNVGRETNDFWIVKNLLTYTDTYNDVHDLTVLAGQEVQESSWEGVNVQDGDFVGNEVPVLGTGNANDIANQFRGSSALESYFGRAIYSFDRRYNLTVSLRADGSSKFAEGNRWGYFPSVSASWRLSNESFMQDFDAIQDIKIYGGYGEVGNQNIPNFAYGVRLNTVNTGLGTGFEYANYENPDLTWESSTQTNLGLDFGLFNSRLGATVEVYNKVSRDFLYQLAVTDFVTGGQAPGGIAAPWVNLGEMVNRGIDVSLSYNTIDSPVRWSSVLTFSHYRNEVTELLGDLTINGQLYMNDSNENVTRTEVGQPVGMFYGYEVEGLFRTTADIEGAPIQFGRRFEDALFDTNWLGDIKYRDVNGDGVINADDRTVIGNPHPDFTFGFQNDFAYKAFDLSVFLQGSYGNDVFNGVNRTLTAGSSYYVNQSPEVLDFWSVDNPDGQQPRLVRGSESNPNIRISDRYIEDGSYLRIQNVRLGYTLPSETSETVGINRLKIYGSIQNLWTFTNYSGYDPEVGTYNQNALLMGVDNGRYPSPRTFTLGLNVEL
ncbi:SusC/RagA family TonB-linked outer membrane protein [Salinimicrobium marinum]|uniref:SusC/RagA family TonB-linked outer membrane protein n=1 Tax=Salinimicrobium marinum TaxID=680283 RepID=A0A918SH76_9FLAO|nr:TonB-dependent receptor [Salinimicrobium marinum]GHA41875.1 SusC/RagA family TonB-linked outer membrane protein [Salinimicrobium marinum]